MSDQRTTMPLEGVVVLDASSIIAGPLCATVLERQGATVVKVELPDRGDGIRAMGAPGARSTYWSFLGQGRRCVSCRLSHPDGAALFVQLVRHADVVIENFRPGTMERWGLGPDRLHDANSDLVIVRISGFGRGGPYEDRAGYGTLGEAMGGFAHHTGDPLGPPTLPGFPVADSITGLLAASAVGAALYERATGAASSQFGAVIDANLLSSMAFVTTPRLIEYQLTGVVPNRQGNRLYGGAPRNAAKCADGQWLAYSAHSPAVISNVVRAVGLAEDDRFSTTEAAIRNGDALDEAIVAWVAERDRPQALSALVDLGVPAGPVNTAHDILQDPNLRARGDLVDVWDEASKQHVTIVASPIEFDGEREPARATGFDVGAHNAEVYGDLLGLSEVELAALSDRGVI